MLLTIRTVLFFVLLAINIFMLPVSATNSNDVDLNNTVETLYFMGYKDNKWILFYKKINDTDFKSIETASEPRELYFSSEENLIYYLDAESKLRKLELKSNDTITRKQEETILFTPSENDSYAQLFWDKASGLLYLVKMPHGKSSEADIVVWDKGMMKPVVRQISSQFEPFIYDKHWLYYGHVHCSLDCGRIIQEIWRKNLISGEAEQLSLLGQISRQAIVDNKGEWVYFSSNKEGSYHIWRQSLTHTNTLPVAQQVSVGGGTDTDPAVTSFNELFFIRHTPKGKALLMRQSKEGTMSLLPLPAGVSEIRNLRINP